MRLTVLMGLILLLAYSSAFGAESQTNVGLNTGYADNVFLDSAKTGDAFTSPYLTYRLYPSPSFEIALSASYTGYHNSENPSSLAAGGSVTCVSVVKDRPLSFYISGNSYLRRFGEWYQGYDNTQSGLSSELRYRMMKRIHLRLGGAFSFVNYLNDVSGDNYGYGIYTGINSILWGSNTIDLETGIEHTVFTGMDDFPNEGWNNSSNRNEVGDILNLAYFSTVFSRSLGDHTGISFGYAFRRFISEDNIIAYSLTIDNLSPWASFWEGQAVSADIKSFVLPHVIVNGGARWQEADFADALESRSTGGVETLFLQAREDHQLRLKLELKRPLVIAQSRILNPSLGVIYIDNRSTHSYYDYSSFSVSLNIDLQF